MIFSLILVFINNFFAKPTHALDSAVVVICLALNIGAYLGVWQHQELFTLDTRQDAICYVLRAEHTIHVITAKAARPIFNFGIFIETDQARRHGLRADQADLDAVVTVRNGS